MNEVSEDAAIMVVLDPEQVDTNGSCCYCSESTDCIHAVVSDPLGLATDSGYYVLFFFNSPTNHHHSFSSSK